MQLKYAQYLQLPIKELSDPQMVFNVNGTPNQSREIKHYTDLNMQTGRDHTTFQFFLTNIGESKVILGYPWMCAIQLHIDWKRGWIDYEHLPIVFHVPGTRSKPFIQQNMDQEMQVTNDAKLSGMPPNYRHHLEKGDHLLIV